MRRFLVLATATVLLAGLSGATADASNWNLTALNQSFNQVNTSSQTNTVQIVNLTTDSGTPINDSQHSGTIESHYNFSSSGLVWLNKGYWYAEFEANKTGGRALFEANGTTSSDSLADAGEEANATRILNTGNLTVDLKNDFSTKKKAGSDKSMEVNVTDAFNNTDEENAVVHVYFTNVTWTSGLVELGYNSNKNLYTNTVTLPDKPGSTYVTHVNASASDQGYINGGGSNSEILDTKPALDLQISSLETSGSSCNNQSWMTECESGAEIEANTTIESSTADSVNLSIFFVKDSGGLVEHENLSLEKKSGEWTTNLEFPEVNRSKFTDTVRLKFNATNSDREDVEWRNITSRSFQIKDKSNPNAFQGDSYTVKISLEKYFSSTVLNSSDFKNGSIDINDPDGNHFNNFTLSDMSYSSETGLFKNKIDIPSDATTGSYTSEITIFDIFLQKKTNSDAGFTVKSVDQTFNATGSIDIDINETKVYEKNFTVTNQESNTNDINISFTGGIEGIASVNDTSISLSGDETADYTVDFNITKVTDTSGKIKLEDTDSDYSENISVDLNAPDCDLEDGDLCLRGSGDWLNNTVENATYVNENVDLTYQGTNDDVSIDVNVTDDLEQILTVTPSSFNLSGTRQIDLNYSGHEPGTYKGDIRFESDGDTVVLHSKLETNYSDTDSEEEETSIEAQETVDLGEVVSGESPAKDIWIENTGTTQVDSIEASSETFEASIKSETIETDENITSKLSFDSITEGSGSVTVTASTENDEATAEIDIEMDFVPDYSQKAEDLRTRIIDLQQQATDSGVKSQLDGLNVKIEDIKTAFDKENYDEAERQYNSLQTEVDNLEQQVNSAPRPGDDTDQQEPGGSSSGGGGGILPLAGALIFLLIVGFIVYTSIIPEEGDPLYNALGK